MISRFWYLHFDMRLLRVTLIWVVISLFIPSLFLHIIH